MERREATPCFECGHFPEELAKISTQKPEFAEYQLFGRAKFSLCIRCYMDLFSWSPDFLGRRICQRDVEFLREIYPLPKRAHDFVCPECNARLDWLNAYAACSEIDAQ